MKKQQKDKKQSQPSPHFKPKGCVFYGLHPIIACIHNPNRHIHEIYTCQEVYENLEYKTQQEIQRRNLDVKIVSKRDIAHFVPENVPHQGIVAVVSALPSVALETVLDTLQPDTKNIVVVLDQICDPHNVGAILRSSAIFGANVVIVVDKNSPNETAVLAKSASGALEKIPFVRVNNMKRCLESLKKYDFWCIGMSGNTDMDIKDYTPSQNTAIIMGAEGSGMRRLTQETCDTLVRINTPCADTIVDSLNVSNATAIALHHMVSAS